MLNFSKLGYIPLIILDDGHGPETAGKRTPTFPDGTVIHENTWNKAVINLIAKDAQRLGFKVYLVAPEDTDVPLQTRTNRANAAMDAYLKELDAQGIKYADKMAVSIYYSQHYNALLSTFDGSNASGVETYYYPNSTGGKRLAELVHKYVIQGTKQVNRGIKTAAFHVLKYTHMYAILQEAGFMDDPVEAARMIDPVFQKETATQALMGMCEFYGLEYLPDDSSTQSDPEATCTPIIGPVTGTAAQGRAWAASKGASSKFIELVDTFWEIAVAVGVNPVVAYCQSAKETAFGNFGGVLDASFMNPCGMKTSSGGGNYDPNAHQRFESWEQGIIAQVDHLALYAGAEGYPKANTPDPRHFPFIKGKASNTVEGLGGNWAPSATYGNDIVKMMAQLESTPAAPEKTPAEISVDNGVSDGVITDVDYWLEVLNGTKTASAENIKFLIDKYHNELEKLKA